MPDLYLDMLTALNPVFLASLDGLDATSQDGPVSFTQGDAANPVTFPDRGLLPLPRCTGRGAWFDWRGRSLQTLSAGGSWPPERGMSMSFWISTTDTPQFFGDYAALVIVGMSGFLNSMAVGMVGQGATPGSDAGASTSIGVPALWAWDVGGNALMRLFARSDCPQMNDGQRHLVTVVSPPQWSDRLTVEDGLRLFMDGEDVTHPDSWAIHRNLSGSLGIGGSGDFGGFHLGAFSMGYLALWDRELTYEEYRRLWNYGRLPAATRGYGFAYDNELGWVGADPLGGLRWYDGTTWQPERLDLGGGSAGVIASPVAQFTASVTSGKAPLSVTFTSTSYDRNPSGSITSEAWNFGAGQGTASGRAVTHTFSTAGTYSVSLTVTNAQGRTSTATRTITVAAATQTYTKSIRPAWYGTYTGSGSRRTDTTNLMQGYYSSGWGNQKSAVCYTWGLPAGAVVTKVTLTVETLHFGYDAGGTVVIGTHGDAIRPTTWPPSGASTNRLRYKSSKTGTKVVDVTAIAAAGIQSGAIRGFIFGPGPSSDLEYYGYHRNNPLVTITYTV